MGPGCKRIFYYLFDLTYNHVNILKMLPLSIPCPQISPPPSKWLPRLCRRLDIGFTLIELMVVILLISVLLAVAIPRFESGVIQDPMKKVSRWMINTIRALRSTAVQQQKLQALVIDLNDSRMWVINADMSNEALAMAADKAFAMPQSIQIIDVQFPQREAIGSGTAEIYFYPSGYSDKAVIHLENDDAERFSYLLEPLLPKVKLFEEWIFF